MGQPRIVPAVALFAVLTCGSIVRAETITLTSIKDNTLYDDPTGAVSNGTGSAMFAGRNSQASQSIRRALVAFDISAAIPPQAAINSVSLTLHNNAANDTSESLALYRLLVDWGEGASVAGGGQGSGAPAAPGDATWLHTFHDAGFWTTPGGDFAAAPSATTIVAGPGAYSWSAPALAGDVQSWLDGGWGNFGWIVLGNEINAGTAKRFATRESGDPMLAPTLTVDFTPVPEPQGGVLMLMAIILRRRRGSCPSVA